MLNKKSQLEREVETLGNHYRDAWDKYTNASTKVRELESELYNARNNLGTHIEAAHRASKHNVELTKQNKEIKDKYNALLQKDVDNDPHIVVVTTTPDEDPNILTVVPAYAVHKRYVDTYKMIIMTVEVGVFESSEVAHHFINERAICND